MREEMFLAVCNALGVDYKEAATKSRLREYVIARQMYIVLVKELYGNRYTYRQIGSMALFEHKFGHSIVWHHLKKFNEQINHPSMAEIKQIYEDLIKQFSTIKYGNKNL